MPAPKVSRWWATRGNPQDCVLAPSTSRETSPNGEGGSFQPRMDSELYQNVLYMRPYRVQGRAAFRQAIRRMEEPPATRAWQAAGARVDGPRAAGETDEIDVPLGPQQPARPSANTSWPPTSAAVTGAFLASFTYPPYPSSPHDRAGGTTARLLRRSDEIVAHLEGRDRSPVRECAAQLLWRHNTARLSYATYSTCSTFMARESARVSTEGYGGRLPAGLDFPLEVGPQHGAGAAG